MNVAAREIEQAPMLELRPSCEQCNKALPPNSTEARICSYECTFCSACVEHVLGNVCPNCGGGVVPCPIRPSKNWKGDNFSVRIQRAQDPDIGRLTLSPISGSPRAFVSSHLKRGNA